MSEDWIATPRPNSSARLRLFCFHSAGSGAAMFVPWAALLPCDVELNIIQMPGRENRIKESPYSRIEPVISALDDYIFPLLDRPFAIFGLSMGALIGFELARRLRNIYAIEPVHLFAASRRAPQAPDRLPLIAGLPGPAFLAAVQTRYQAIPEVIRNDPELLDLFLPLLKADFHLLEAYTYREDAPFTCPLTVLYGREDSTLTAKDLTGWQLHTRGKYTQQVFPGGHFFITQQASAIVDFLLHQGLGGI